MAQYLDETIFFFLGCSAHLVQIVQTAELVNTDFFLSTQAWLFCKFQTVVM